MVAEGNNDGTVDSISFHCFGTIACSQTEHLLIAMEAVHLCIPMEDRTAGSFSASPVGKAVKPKRTKVMGSAKVNVSGKNVIGAAMCQGDARE